MAKLEKILLTIPPNYGDLSKKALEHAVMLTKLTGCTLKLLMVINDSAWMDVKFKLKDSLLDEIKEESLTYANEAIQKFLEEVDTEGLELNPIVVAGEPVEEIIEYAEKEDVDMIVMGTQGKTGLAYLAMGSVTEKVMKNAQCPVLCVRISGK